LADRAAACRRSTACTTTAWRFLPAKRARSFSLERHRPVAGQASPPLAGDPFVYGAFDRKTNTRRGWYFDLPAGPEQGERLVFQPVLSDGQLFFNTLIPNASACSADGGGRSCAVNAMTGLSQGGSCTPSGIGMLGAPHLVQLGMAGFGATDAFGRRSETKRLGIVSIGARDARGGRAGGMSNAQPAGDGKMVQTGGRLNWREVVDYRGAKK
jgi:type IV pilus assembly protein PilY1